MIVNHAWCCIRVVVLVAGMAVIGAGSSIPATAGAPNWAGVPSSGSSTLFPRQLVSAAPHKTRAVRLYLIAVNDHGKSGPRIGCGDSLVSITLPTAPTTAPLSAAFRLLVSKHSRYYGNSGLYNALYQSRLSFKKATVAKGKAIISLTGTFRLGGVCDDPRVQAQLRHTALQFPTVHSATILINDKRLSGYFTH